MMRHYHRSCTMLVAITPIIACQWTLAAREVYCRQRNELNTFNWNFAAPMQTMDLTTDIWTIVRDCMSIPEWAKAYKINRATHALKPWVAVEVRMGEGLPFGEQDLVEQLQLDSWPNRHSLFLNLQQLRKAVQLTPAQTKDIQSASNKLPRLRCLHLIGRDNMPLTESSIEGVLVSALTEQISVLSLQVGMIEMPLAAPNLQHLVVALKCNKTWVDQLFLAVCLLKRLKTFYVQSCGKSSEIQIGEDIDLTELVHLQHVAVQGVSFIGQVHLPAECQLHATIKDFLDDAVTNGGVNVYTGVTLLYDTIYGWEMWARDWLCYRYCSHHPPPLSNLRRLRLILSNDICSEYYRDEDLRLHIDSDVLPHLKVLELAVQDDREMSLCIKTWYLTSVVVLAAGKLNIDVEDLCEDNRDTLEEIYIQSSADFWCYYEDIRQARLVNDPNWGFLPAEEYPEYFEDEQGQYIAQKPANFMPGNFEECCCNACPECLARAGVPILCEQAWTSDGFDKHLRPSCSREP